jgi:multidrug transporter EmrE-like cation transporter
LKPSELHRNVSVLRQRERSLRSCAASAPTAAYAVWTGIGAAGSVILGIVLIGESASSLRMAWIALILVGIAGLKFSA